MTVFAVIAAALGGGIVAAWLGSWFDRLSALEVARLVVLGELMANLAIHHSFDLLGPDEIPPQVHYSTSAWLTHRDYPDVWLQLGTFYGVVASIPGYSQQLDPNTEKSITYAVANLDVLELTPFELVPVYGPRRAYSIWRERRRRAKESAQPAA
jgi:hypothetical protein